MLNMYLIQNTISGVELSGYIDLRFNEFHRETSVELTNFMGINEASVNFQSLISSGFLGLAPYTADLANKEKNFMYQLKK